jgi:hypothetical protein
VRWSRDDPAIDDPWANDMLTIESVEPWSVWLRAATLRGLR